MKKKIIGIFVCTLLFTTALTVVGDINKTTNLEVDRISKQHNIGVPNTIPNDEFFDLQWSLHNTGQTGGLEDCDIDAPEAWDLETGSSDVVIAIIDTGVDYTHPDLADKIWNNDDEIPGNGIDDDENGYIDDVIGWNFYNNNNDPKDYQGHGTVCAGVFGAVTDNNQGIAGVCWNCQIMPLKYNRYFGIPGFDITIEAIKYAADNGADIISMSFGTYAYNESFEDAVNYAYEKGVFMCASAGNDNINSKRYPAAFENVTAVAATNDTDGKMYHYIAKLGAWVISNYGDWVDVVAPGQEIYSTFPSYDCDVTPYGFAKYYDYLSGTSLAVPHVAGLAALLLSKDPLLTPDGLKTLICENVDPYDSTYDLGSGRINAQKALYALINPPDAPTIKGPDDGKPGTLYDFTFNAVDPDNNQVKYIIDWGDGNNETTTMNPSGTDVKVSHTWDKSGTCIIKAKAQDSNGLIGPESTKTVKIPRTRVITWSFIIMKILERFPLLERILNFQ